MDAPTIFVADDDPQLRSTVADILEVSGWRTRTFADGLSCLEAATADPPSCILADLDMPNMDGIAMINALDAHQVRVPVIVLTGLAPGSMGLSRLQAAAFAVLRKPFDVERLLRVIRQALPKPVTQ